MYFEICKLRPQINNKSVIYRELRQRAQKSPCGQRCSVCVQTESCLLRQLLWTVCIQLLIPICKYVSETNVGRFEFSAFWVPKLAPLERSHFSLKLARAAKLLVILNFEFAGENDFAWKWLIFTPGNAAVGWVLSPKHCIPKAVHLWTLLAVAEPWCESRRQQQHFTLIPLSLFTFECTRIDLGRANLR